MNRAVFDENRSHWLSSRCAPWVRVRNGVAEGFFSTREEAQPEVPSEDATIFQVVSSDTEAAQYAASTAPSDELLCATFLDADCPEELFFADRVLEYRGYTARLQRILRYAAFSGVWWNGLVWWDEYKLDIGDVLYGWTGNLAILWLPTAVALLIVSGWKVALLSVPTFLLAELALFSAFAVIARSRRLQGTPPN